MGGAGGLAAAVAVAVPTGGLAAAAPAVAAGGAAAVAPAAAGVPLLPFFKFILFLAIFKINIILYMYICLKETVGTKGIRLTLRDLQYGTGTTHNGLLTQWYII
jgi:hypothetical protein